ncbi:hypothetical protein B0I74DRAFT_162215, partial [Yarrowia lipolytica]
AILNDIATGISNGIVSAHNSNIDDDVASKQVETLVNLLLGNSDLQPAFTAALENTVKFKWSAALIPPFVSLIQDTIAKYEESSDYVSATNLVSSIITNYNPSLAIHLASINVATWYGLLSGAIGGFATEPAASRALVTLLEVVTSLECQLGFISSECPVSSVVSVSSVKEPVTSSSVSSAKKPVAPSSVSSVKEPVTSSSVSSAKKPVTPLSVSSAKEPVTSSSVSSAKKPVTPLSVSSAKEPVTSSSVSSAKKPVTPLSVSSAKEPATPLSVSSSEEQVTLLSVSSVPSSVSSVSSVSAPVTPLPASSSIPPSASVQTGTAVESDSPESDSTANSRTNSIITKTVTFCDSDGCITPVVVLSTNVPVNATSTTLVTVCDACKGKTVTITVPCDTEASGEASGEVSGEASAES